MSFQVVEVHKLLLAISGLVDAGQKVIFDKDDPHIRLSRNEKVPMACAGRTYDIEIWIRTSGF